MLTLIFTILINMTLPSVGFVKTIPEDNIFENNGIDLMEDTQLVDKCFIDEYGLSYKEFLETNGVKEYFHKEEHQSLVDCLVLNKQLELESNNELLNEDEYETVNESNEELGKQEEENREEQEEDSREEQEEDSTEELSEDDAREEQEEDSTEELSEDDAREEQEEDSAREEQEEDSTEELDENDVREEQELEKDTLETEKSEEKKEEDLESTLFWSAGIQAFAEQSVNKLGHINRTATIYKELGKTETVSTNNLLHAVYYVKKQATYNGERYYELSRNWNGTGVVGWAKASDLSVRDHVLINRDQFDMQVKGTGNAYTKAWGGSQDLVASLSGKRGTIFKINLTEQVGNHTWYRGTLDGQQVWIQSTHVEKPKIVEEATNKLGHINRTATIYKELGKTETVSTSNLLHAVYYVKKQATYNGERYYELSKNWNGTGVVGWAKASDLSVRDHVLVNRNASTMYVIGSGNAYSKAWGGSQDLVYNLSNRKGKQFLVNLTERVGNATWHRGTIEGQQVWIQANHVTTDVVPIENFTRYNIALEEAVNRQFGPYAVTDTYTQYVSAEHVSYSSANGGFYYVDTPVLNVRSGPGTAYAVVDQLVQGTRLSIRRSTNGWYQLMWVNAKKEDISYYMNPFNFLDDARQRFQFLDLSKPSGASANVLNNYLTGKGTLSNQGQAFIDAGMTHGVNDIYLLSHALLETGHGTSTLARGVEVNGTVVYNMYGIGARDHCPIECGSQYAYDQGWDTPYKAIVGGASFIGNSYIKSGQNTLYKMRWNPAGLVNNGRPTHQYATDIGWASKQVHTMYNLYQEIGSYSLTLDIPDYNG